MDFPKRMSVRGVEITVNSWEEFDEVVHRYGRGDADRDPRQREDRVVLSEADLELVRQFVNAHGHRVLVKDARAALDVKDKKKAWSALQAWATRTGLSVVRSQLPKGRAYQLTEESRGLARRLLAR